MKKQMAIWAVLLIAAFSSAGCGRADKAYDQGMAAAEQGDYQKAEAQLKKALEENDERAEYYIGYGMVLNAQGRYEKAIEQFERARQDVETSIANANNKQVYYGEAMSYFYLGDLAKASELCEKALSFKEPSSIDGEIYGSQGILQEMSGDTEGAVKSYQTAVKKDQENWQAYYRLSALYEDAQDRDSAEQAKGYLETAYQEGAAEAGYFLGMLSAGQEDEEKAQEYFHTYVKNKNGKYILEAYGQLAAYAIEEGDMALAEKYISAGRDKKDTAAGRDLWKQEIILYEQQGEYAQAKNSAEDYLKQYPDDQEVEKEVLFLETRVRS